MYFLCFFSGCYLLNQVELVKEKCHSNLRMFPSAESCTLFFQMLLSFWGLLNNCALKKKNHNKDQQTLQWNKMLLRPWHCWILHNAPFCCLPDFLEIFVHCIGISWAPYPFMQREDLIPYCLFRQYPSRNLWYFHMCKVISRMNVLLFILSWIIYSSLGERTAVAWLF